MRVNRLAVLTFLVVLCVLNLTVAILPAAETRATLSTTAGARIDENQLDQYIDSFIPTEANRLLVFTQCYGGNMAQRYAGRSNTAIGSATSPGERAHYGGYDNDAANALTPGATSTGQTVHDAGTAGKDSRETPSTGGGLALSGFSLEPITPTSAVQSRHVVVYAGKPDSSAGRDNAQRDKIKSNFAGQSNTTVTTVGGLGASEGWDKPGSAKGLRDAIKAAGAAIANSLEPSKEQFILYITDHGDLHEVTPVTTPVPSGNSIILPGIPSFNTPDLDDVLLPNPGFTVRIELPMLHPVDVVNYQPLFLPGQWSITLDPDGPEGPFVLTDFEEQYLEFDNDMIGDMPGEGLDLFFEMPTEQWGDSFFDVLYEVQIENMSGMDVMVMEFSQDTGAVPKGAIPGDANSDGTVDLQDFGLLKENFGGVGGWDEGDFNDDGIIDLQDFGLLKENFGSGTGATVPEPMTLTLLTVGAMLSLLRKKKR